METDYQKPEYLSYNAMARSPMVMGIPFMPFLLIGCMSMLLSTFGGLWFGLVGWLFGCIGIPILLFIKMISVTDDRAVIILISEFKWFIVKKLSGSSSFFGGALFLSPIKFGRRVKDVKQYIETTSGR